MNNILWQAENIIVQAGNKTLLDIPKLTLPKEQTIAVIGPNGAGKSTLLRVLMGQYRHIPVWCNGKKVAEEVAHGKVAWVGQHERFELPISVLDYILLGCYPYLSWFAQAKADDIVQADQLMADFDLLHLRDKRIQTLSGGERQRAAIARALMQKTEIILLDEPSNHLDIRHQYRMMNDLQQRKNNHKISMIMVLHDLNLAANYADYILLLNHGKLVQEGTPDEVMSAELLSEVYQWHIRMHREQEQIFFHSLCHT